MTPSQYGSGSEVEGKPELLERLIKDRGLEVFLSIMDKPSTAGELADRLGCSRAKMNYILDSMLKQEFITLHSEKVSGGIVEKCYSSKADTFHLLVGSSYSDSERLSAALYILGVVKTALLTNMNRGDLFHMGMVHAKVPVSRVDEYMARLKELQQEFDDENLVSNDPDCEWHTLAVSIFRGPTPSN
ncbi:hypothetical protein ACE3NQ_16710 [Paenibacillus terreus]|uniref:Helix-turn-helix domain-containing protein n=1 Tax=Paenibacillus terreus TaxID=1387834 RepID=A0ABV5BAI6_9BACL